MKDFTEIQSDRIIYKNKIPDKYFMDEMPTVKKIWK